MPSAAAIRLQIESTLAQRIPSALTPPPRAIRPLAPTGVSAIDELLQGGIPIGSITEMVGPQSSGRTAVALSFVSSITHAGGVCAWVDVSDALCPESAAEAGVDLARLLWVRCGVTASASSTVTGYNFTLPEMYRVAEPAIKGLHGGGCGGHPRNEARKISDAIGDLLRHDPHVEPFSALRPETSPHRAANTSTHSPKTLNQKTATYVCKPWERMEQALRVTDLLLQAGGFSGIVLDMASLAPEFVTRVPLATWFRYGAAAERTQVCFVLLTQHPCAKSSGELLLRFAPGEVNCDETSVFIGCTHHMQVERRRFTHAPSNVVSLRKPPHSETEANVCSIPSWVGEP